MKVVIEVPPWGVRVSGVWPMLPREDDSAWNVSGLQSEGTVPPMRPVKDRWNGCTDTARFRWNHPRRTGGGKAWNTPTTGPAAAGLPASDGRA